MGCPTVGAVGTIGIGAGVDDPQAVRERAVRVMMRMWEGFMGG